MTLRLLLGALAAGTVLLLPSFLYLYRVFGKLRRSPQGAAARKLESSCTSSVSASAVARASAFFMVS
ncbi:MAG: hypothetical protein ACLGI9_16325 [Thermoanaerobaculia bacterium]